MVAGGKSVAIIGIGIMGSAIARNLMAAGFKITGHDVDPARQAWLEEAGGQAAGSAAEAASSADLVLTSLPSAEALDTTVAGAGGLLQTQRPGLAVAELSTLPLDVKERNRARLAESGMIMLDCPLSGTGAQAAAGDLAVYASGDRAAYDRLAPCFAGFSRTSHFLGAFGNGTKMKLVANLLVAIHNVASAEAMVLGMRAGLEPGQIVEMVKSGAGNSRIFELRAPMMARDEYLPATMKIDIWQKDMAIIGAFAEQLGVELPLFRASAPVYAAAQAEGLGEQDTAAVCRVLEGPTRRARG